MVGPTPPQQLQIQTPSTAAAPATLSAEDEALKRNTDCVYFLASPLTCKKGSECEYRHSDVARLNPRDCWYWLNGSCLNPKCGFRHPPLDGFLGAQVQTPTGSSVPPVASVAPTPNVPYGSGKQGVPCIFFQQGFCLKGDRCPFFHAPISVPNKAPPHPVSTASTEKNPFKKAFGRLEKCVQGKTFSQANTWKSGGLPLQAQPIGKLGTHLSKNDSAFNENVLPPNSVIDVVHHRHKPKGVPPTNGNPVGRSNRVHQSVRFDDHSSIQNKGDDISRELSPGFDVLVDDELRGNDFYHGEDQYGRDAERNEYDIGRSADYTSVADNDQDAYHDVYERDSHDRLAGRSGRVQHRASSEIIQGESAHLERRRYGRAYSPEEVRESDLRHRLSKHKRVNGLRSVISHDYASEKHVDDRGYQGSRRDRQHLPSHDSSVASRLRGRIKLPSRSSSPTNGADMGLDRETDRARNRGRLSLERPQLFSQQGRLRDRIKGRVQEDLSNAGRNNSGPRLRKDISENNSDFSGPRRLAELKGRKTAETSEQNVDEQQALGKRKFQKHDSYQQSGGDLSFEGPMPLQEILKRKRRSETGMPSDKSEDYQHERKDHSLVTSSISRSRSDLGQKEESDPPSGEKNGPQETISAGHQSPLHDGANELEAEEGMIVEEEDDQDPEGHDQRDYDYEQVDGEDYNLDEGENADAGEEYLDEDDDDGDDFAKKMGVVFS
ncbi:zinc finger CCCH domain-containing protein 17-like [Nicotiana tabacum]|uniref:Zinc finger CCCH domain-containing protein 17-like n=1 Tax=Nicotiana tabacum TaxID=4097 RepID=A0A1S4DNQ4_TOBAC|nr:PREDICTED: zinc finger CCCH domain-containing protein 17-like [Nicotiana tabacum]